MAGRLDAELRAASIVAGDRIVMSVNERLASSNYEASAAAGRLLAMHLDYYLWNLGKDPAFRVLVRGCSLSVDDFALFLQTEPFSFSISAPPCD